MGEYEPNDSRNVTGANNQSKGQPNRTQAANEGTDNQNANQTGQHWQSTDAPISQSHTQGHGQDPGMRSQAPSQAGGGQMGGSHQGSGQQQQSQSGGGQMGSGSGQTGQAAQFESDPRHASELNQQAVPGGGREGGEEARARAGGGDHPMAGQIREHMEVIGADGVHVGTVDHVQGDRIKLTKRDSSAGYEGEQHAGHHHYISLGLVAGVEGDTVRLSANADVAYAMEEEENEGGAGAA